MLVKLALAVALTCTSVYGETLSLDLKNNTPLFTEAGCKSYEGKEALRAIYQMVAASRMSLELISTVVEEPALVQLLESKAKAGKRVSVYSTSSHRAPIESYSLGDAQPASIIITTDYSTIGIGNIRLSNPIKMYSTFVVCRSGETFDKMRKDTRKYTRD